MKNQSKFRCREAWEMVYSGAGTQLHYSMSQPSRPHVGGGFLLKGSGPQICQIQDPSNRSWPRGLFPTRLTAQHTNRINDIHLNAFPPYKAVCPPIKWGSCSEKHTHPFILEYLLTHVNKWLCPLIRLEQMTKRS